jgi:hypothetical protein
MEIRIKRLAEAKISNYCLLPEMLCTLLNLSKSKEYELHVGQLSQFTSIEVIPSKTLEVWFSPTLYEALLLTEDQQIGIWVKEEKIFLGPVVGIFVNRFFYKGIGKGYAPESALRHMQANEVAHCLSYYFTLHDIDWVGKKIKGYSLLPGNKEWLQQWFPMPNVIYDRAVRIEADLKPMANQIREQFRSHLNLFFINSKDYLGKWQPFSKLAKYPEINGYLPRTTVYTGFSDVLMMLKRFDTIFLKASYGSRGQGILSIQQVEDSYTLNFYNTETHGFQEVTTEDIDELRKYVQDFTKDNSFVVQQGIRLLTYCGRKMDMRVLLEKNRRGEWQVIYNQCRVAKGSSTITNLACGGEIYDYKQLYPSLTCPSGPGPLPTEKEIADVSVKIAQTLEKEFGPFGEFGMDMALDENGRIWFLEANTKPDKNPEPGLEDLEGVCPQFLAIFEYAQFLVKGEEGHE